MSTQLSDFSPQSLVSNDGEHIFTTSLLVAQTFVKDHKNVLQRIEKLDCSPRFTELNFQPSSYLDSTGRSLPAYYLTRDGFVFLVMGFTGKKAAEWKEKFLEAFNAMERDLLQARLNEIANAAASDVSPVTCSDINEVARVSPVSVKTPIQKFTPASDAELSALRGLIAFWSGIEEIPQANLAANLLEAHSLPDFDHIQPWDVDEMEWHIIKKIYRATGEVTSIIPNTPEVAAARRVLEGLFDFAAGRRDMERNKMEGIACMLCSVPDLQHLSARGLRKAALLVWSFLNRYPMYRDCLSEAKYAVKEISH